MALTQKSEGHFDIQKSVLSHHVGPGDGLILSGLVAHTFTLEPFLQSVCVYACVCVFFNTVLIYYLFMEVSPVAQAASILPPRQE